MQEQQEIFPEFAAPAGADPAQAEPTADNISRLASVMPEPDELFMLQVEYDTLTKQKSLIDRLKLENQEFEEIENEMLRLIAYDEALRAKPFNPNIQEEIQQAKKEIQQLQADVNALDLRLAAFHQKRDTLRAEFEALEDSSEALPHITAKQAKEVEYPLDKINSNVWNLFDLSPANGQIAFATEKRGSPKEANILYSINFGEIENELSITKKLTPFDKRIYIAISALYNAGNRTMSAAQIYTAMGNTSRPNSKDLTKINDSLTKMGAARVYIDNTQEISVNKKYSHFKYDAALLPFERCSVYINNQLCESAIQVFREPPLTTFAKGRKQITTISKKLLDSPISKTDSNLRIDDYLIECISHIKSGRINNKLLYTTIYERCGITDKKQKQRTPEKIKRYLDHYKECGFIKDYTESSDGITILY